MLAIGDKIPDIQLQDHEGNHFSLKDQLGKPLVIFFYPKNKCILTNNMSAHQQRDIP